VGGHVVANAGSSAPRNRSAWPIQNHFRGRKGWMALQWNDPARNRQRRRVCPRNTHAYPISPPHRRRAGNLVEVPAKRGSRAPFADQFAERKLSAGEAAGRRRLPHGSRRRNPRRGNFNFRAAQGAEFAPELLQFGSGDLDLDREVKYPRASNFHVGHCALAGDFRQIHMLPVHELSIMLANFNHSGRRASVLGDLRPCLHDLSPHISQSSCQIYDFFIQLLKLQKKFGQRYLGILHAFFSELVNPPMDLRTGRASVA
jgi:hypothetical protein